MKRMLPALALASTAVAAAALQYPAARRAETADVHHGVRVEDPYRWLEDVDSAETRAWVAAQNEMSLPYLRELPGRDALRQRLGALWNYERYGVPHRKAGGLFYTRNDGLQNQPVLYVLEPGAEAPRVLLDPNALARDGSVALTQWEVSPDGRTLAYGLSRAGSDWTELRVLDVAEAEDLDDELVRVKFSEIAWTGDSRGFFYSRYPDTRGEPGDPAYEALAHQKLYYHRIGEEQRDDRLVYEQPDQPLWLVGGEVSDDHRFLFVTVRSGSGGNNALYYRYLGEPAQPALDGKLVPLVTRIESQYEPVGNEGSILYLLTNRDAPRKRVVAVDLRDPSPQHWVTLIPESDDTIEKVLLAGRQFVVVVMRDASNRLLRYALNGKPSPELAMPGLGSVTDTPLEDLYLSGAPHSTELFYSFTAFTQPPQNYRCDLARGRCVRFQPLQLAFDPAAYVTEQVFFQSKDGTRVPMFVTRRKGQKPGPRPTLLYGYGGFEQSLVPSFARPELAVPALAWMEQGGVYAVANLRGGGEYGRAWHDAGTKLRKQNVFDDFIAAAQHLVRAGVTTTSKLAIHGRSNGGLLVGAVLNQKPGLFAAGVADVGVMDMLRFHKFTIGHAWVTDYGSAENRAEFRALRAYSPYHNVKSGQQYPAVLITTADRDDRVVPGHSFKYAAALQAAQGGAAPVLIRIETQAGHGAGKPTAKLIEEVADRVAFLTAHTGGAPGR